ncbi:TolC family protein [Sphingomonas mali]|uniref:TolC family protein n=1 Tax=Sphingomonas mali TaxID=40682 RepID=UPI000835F89E|nr:TolC family protein [Sphingomonas mali]
MLQSLAPRSGPALALLLLAGCASYTPRPLATTPSDSDIAALSRDAATIDRPYLKPANVDLAAPLDDNALAVIAVLNNPDLKAMRTKAGVADAQVFSARLLPDPTFSLGLGGILSGPDPFSEIASGLGLDLNALRTGKVRRQAAEAQAKQVRLDLAWAEWQTAGQARLQAVRIRRLQGAIDLLRIDDAEAQSLLARNLRAAARGDVASTSVEAVRTDAVATADKLRTAEHDLDAARLELVKLLGLPPETQLRLAPSVDDAPALDPARLTQIALNNRLDLQALRAGYDAQEAAVHKAILDQFPSLALNLNFTRDTGGNNILGPTVDFTLPVWNRNRGGIAVERATREQLKAEYDARLFQTRADIAAAASAVSLARRQRDAVRAQLPELDRLARVSRAAAARGDVSRATAETAEGALRDKRVELATADQTIDEAMIALELLTGVPREDWK